MKFTKSPAFVVGAIMLVAYFLIALVPDTLWNWFYDYLSFLSWPQVALCAAIAVSAFLFPQIKSETAKKALAIAFALSLPAMFYIFRTQIHCFGGDMANGTVPTDSVLTLQDFLPPLPGKGRLDTYGLSPLCKIFLSSGLLAHYPNMTSMVVSGLYDIVCGGLFIILAIAFLHRHPAMLMISLTMPTLFNFFGNIDCYPLPLCAALGFLVMTRKMFSLEKPNFAQAALYFVFWLFCGWVHPLAGIAGFLPAIIGLRWLNGVNRKFQLSEHVAVIAFCVVMFTVIKIGYGKQFFTAPWNVAPPMFSVTTFLHMLNVIILPIVPLAIFALMGSASTREKRLALSVWVGQAICFLPAYFTQGANDQFPYSLYLIAVAIPWLSLLWRHPVSATATRAIVAINLLLLVPMVWVHSSDLTIRRARTLYAIDDCQHNKTMSWQTHLGLVLSDNLLDNAELKKATLRTFEHGSRQAMPEQFRPGNYLYYVAFLYHFGEFDKGRQLLGTLINNNPGIVKNFLSVRPAFAYMNRKRLWDDLYELFPIAAEKPKLNAVLNQLRENAKKERYCFINPTYAVTEY